MSVDYDLVVIGNSPAGIYAAVEAARLRARVALVTQKVPVADFSGWLDHRVLQEVGRTMQQARRAEQFGIWAAPGSLKPGWLDRAQQWHKIVSETIEILYSPAVLASLGVEVIEGQGEFCRKPTPGLAVNGRHLRSRTYLLAVHCKSVPPEIDGLLRTGYVTAETALQTMNLSRQIPGSVVMIGTMPVGLELAQTLARSGWQVTLVDPAPRILPPFDLEAARLLQAQLEAEGIQIWTETAVTQVKQIQGRKWVQVGNQAMEVDEIVLATGWEPDVAALNLAAVGVDPSLRVNPKLQTSNPRLYVCSGQSDRGYTPQLALAQVRVALKNALFLPLTTFSDRAIPYVVYTDPELVQLGLTELQAGAQYGRDLVILRQPFQRLAKAHLQAETTGFCKFILRRNGEILGAQLVGAQASEMVGAIALALQNRLKIQALATLALPSPTLAEIISQTAHEWQRVRLDRNPGWQDFLESFFNWRRSIT